MLNPIDTKPPTDVLQPQQNQQQQQQVQQQQQQQNQHLAQEHIHNLENGHVSSVTRLCLSL